jgi:uncharacterized protein DUF4440
MERSAEDAIRDMVDRETHAWDRLDADALVGIFHPDMVWAWPPDATAHDPATWVWGMGRFDAPRWRAEWAELFEQHELVHNRRRTVRVSVTPQADGGFAVVDVDTLWRRRSDGAEMRWRGRACKSYSLCDGEWKLIAHTGLLDYGP